MLSNCRIGLYEKALPSSFNWEKRLQTAKQTGYDFMEISIDETDERLQRLYMTASERTTLRNIMDESHFYLESMCLSGHRKYPLGSNDKSIRDKSLDIMKRAIDFSRDLGIRTIQLAGYDVYYEESSPKTTYWFFKNLEKCVEWAEQYHVMLAFETMETPFLNTVEKCMHYIKEINSPWLQIYPDCGNLTNAAFGDCNKVISDLQAGRGHLAAMHLKETAPGKYRDLFPGDGYVDFNKIIPAAFHLGVRRFVTEIWYHDGQDWEANLSRTYQYYRNLMEHSLSLSTI